MDSTTGFGASLEVNDGAADASEKFEGVTTITLPSEEVGEFEETELAQTKADNTTLAGCLGGGPPEGFARLHVCRHLAEQRNAVQRIASNGSPHDQHTIRVPRSVTDNGSTRLSVTFGIGATGRL